MSIYLLAPLVAWLLAQGTKYVLYSMRTGRWRDLRQLYVPGSMPSVHSALVVSLITVIGVVDGLNSSLFAITLIFGLIVAYDAMQVRRATGEQGVAVNELLKKVGLKLAPFQASGHKPSEVAVGAFIGVIAAGLVLSF